MTEDSQRSNLRRLRAVFDDELFVRAQKDVEPTPRAQNVCKVLGSSFVHDNRLPPVPARHHACLAEALHGGGCYTAPGTRICRAIAKRLTASQCQ